MKDEKVFEKDMNLSYDGRQYFVRIPKKISNNFFLPIDEDFKAQFSINPNDCDFEKGKIVAKIEFKRSNVKNE